MLPVVYGNGNRILQTPGRSVISYEMVHDTRVIPLDGRPHIGSRIRQYLGDSRGHWEGNTLVVETTNLTDQTSIGLNGNGLRHSADMKMVERFTRDRRRRAAVRDHDRRSENLHAAVHDQDAADFAAGFQLLPYECHEGNYMLAERRSARERAEDKAIEEDAKKGIVRGRRAVTQENVNAPVTARPNGGE